MTRRQEERLSNCSYNVEDSMQHMDRKAKVYRHKHSRPELIEVTKFKWYPWWQLWNRKYVVPKFSAIPVVRDDGSWTWTIMFMYRKGFTTDIHKASKFTEDQAAWIKWHGSKKKSPPTQQLPHSARFEMKAHKNSLCVANYADARHAIQLGEDIELLRPLHRKG